jgi:IS5 family transposase
MKSFKSYLFREAYKEVRKLGDRLAKIEPLIDWEAFRPLITPLYDNKDPKGGRPNLDEVMMVKLLVLQQWYGLSDPELERQAADRLSFRRFLGFPERVPDSTTVWLFRERLAETGRDRAVWAELQRQLDEKGLKVRKGVAQDATFITADPGHAPAEEPRGEEAKTRRSRDGSWAKKGSKSSFGYKLHAKSDTDLGLIRDLETTTASVHDSQVDLSRPGEVVYLDKAYFGVETRGYSAAMRRATRGHPLDIRDRLRNRRINRKRAPGERPFAVLKRVFDAGHVLVTTLPRVHVKMVFACVCFNLLQLGTLGAGP